MDTARREAIPPHVRSNACAAREVLACLPALRPRRVPPGLAESLCAVVPPTVRIEFQCPPETAPEIIAALLEAGHQVFEGAVPPEAQVFFDRSRGFRLPEWSAIPDAFGAATKLIWSRAATFVLVRGTPAGVEDNPANDFVIVRLAENPHLRLSVPKSLGVLAIGQPIALLGRHDFRFGMDTPLLECVAICNDKKGISHV
ncbi:MAG: hypothetical protein HY260_18610 [Chloroflexi bacterium]|nr:hypothetical protein [Chloroflexota bacterium]